MTTVQITHPAETENASIHVLLTNLVPQVLFARLSITTQCVPVQMDILDHHIQGAPHVSQIKILYNLYCKESLIKGFKYLTRVIQRPNK